jgi:hypothetical protein
VLLQDYSSRIEANLVQSPGTSTVIKIDTASRLVINSIIDVNVDVLSGTYGAGKEFIFTVTFQYDVWVSKPEGVFLSLNVLANSPVNAVLIGSHSQVNNLLFRYIVSPGDSCGQLDYINIKSLTNKGDSRIYDANNFTANSTLPTSSISAKKTITIDTSSPYVISLTTNTSDGEYGVGQVVAFLVAFNRPVMISGLPYLELNPST